MRSLHYTGTKNPKGLYIRLHIVFDRTLQDFFEGYFLGSAACDCSPPVSGTDPAATDIYRGPVIYLSPIIYEEYADRIFSTPNKNQLHFKVTAVVKTFERPNSQFTIQL